MTGQEVFSDVVPVEQRPWMKTAEITNAMIEAIRSGQYKVLRCNFAKGDMVRHVGHFHPATTTIVAVDLALSRLIHIQRPFIVKFVKLSPGCNF